MARSTFSWFLALALFAGVAPAFSQGTGGIIGRVTRAATGAPVPGIQVQILDGSSGNTTGATSGLDGLFVVSGLAPGYYYARTSNGQGFVDELYHEVPCPGSCTMLAGTPILVTANAMTGNVDFTLQAEARLAGTITDAVSRTPLTGVRVSLLSLAGSQLASAVTAPDGSYSIGVPYEGPCLVKADGTDGGYVSELFDNVMCQPECDLSRGERCGRGLRHRDGRPRLRARSRRQHHRAHRRRRHHVAHRRGHRAGRDGSGATRGQATSDAEGRYRALGLAAGTYRVRAVAIDHLGEAFDDIMCPRLDCASTTGAGVSVTLAATTPGIDFALTRGGRIEGTVTGAAATSPLAGINVEVLTGGGSTVSSAPTDDAGRYSVRGLAGGSYFVRTRNGAGFMDELYDNTPCPGGSCLVASGKSIVVTPAATTSGVDFDLMPGGRVTGIVTAQDTGLPLASTHVTIHDAEGRFVGNVFTDSAGMYAFGGLAAATYFVQARSVAHDYIGELFDDRPCPGQQCAATSGTPVVVTLATTTGGVNFALARGGRIAGVVTDALSGAPVPNVAVEVRTASQHLDSARRTNLGNTF